MTPEGPPVHPGLQPSPVPLEVAGDDHLARGQPQVARRAEVAEVDRAVGGVGRAHLEEGTGAGAHLGVVAGQHQVGLRALEDGRRDRGHPGRRGQAAADVVELGHELVVLAGQGPDSASPGPVSTASSWRDGRQRQDRQAPQRLHPLGPGAVGLVQDVVDLAQELRRRRSETCSAAELSDRADRSWRPRTGSQVAGAISGPVEVVVGRAELGGRAVQRRLGRRRRQRRRVRGLPDRLEGVEAALVVVVGGPDPGGHERAPRQEQHDHGAADQPSRASPSSGFVHRVTLLLVRAAAGDPGRPGARRACRPARSYRRGRRRAVAPGNGGPVPVASPRVVLDPPRDRRARHPGRRRARPAVHPLPAVGHGTDHRPGPGPAAPAVRRRPAPPPRRCRPALTPHGVDRRRRSRRRSPRPQRANPSASSRSRRSRSRWWWSRAPTPSSCGRGPATTPAHRCRASRATWPSPATAPRTSTPSTT